MPISQIARSIPGVVLNSASLTNPVKATSTGTISADGISAATSWTIYNYGGIAGGYGIYLRDGGAVTNADQAHIHGAVDGGGIRLIAGTGTAVTLGKTLKSQITGSYASGITLTSATFANPVTATGSVSGASTALSAADQHSRRDRARHAATFGQLHLRHVQGGARRRLAQANERLAPWSSGAGRGDAAAGLSGSSFPLG